MELGTILDHDDPLVKSLEAQWGNTDRHEYMIVESKTYDENFAGATLLGWRLVANVSHRGGLLLERELERG